jgi:hypothetical protein
VELNGPLNGTADPKNGWTCALTLPWEGFRTLYAREFPPKPGDTLRFQAFRFENVRINGRPAAEPQGWALNSHGVYDSHLPDKFAVLEFA